MDGELHSGMRRRWALRKMEPGQKHDCADACGERGPQDEITAFGRGRYWRRHAGLGAAQCDPLQLKQNVTRVLPSGIRVLGDAGGDEMIERGRNRAVE